MKNGLYWGHSHTQLNYVVDSKFDNWDWGSGGHWTVFAGTSAKVSLRPGVTEELVLPKEYLT